MLSQLPNEILTDIVIFSDFESRLNLSKSCHHLKALVSKRYLYEEVWLPEREDALQKALDLFKNNPQYSSQTRYLKFFSSSKESLDQLPAIFPAVHKLSYGAYNSGYNSTSGFLEAMSIWKDTLEQYSAGLNVRLLPKLFANQIFSCLYSTSISLTSSYDSEVLHEFDHLKNAPLLTHLKLYKGVLNIETLEKIHAACPYLKCLEFSAVSFVANFNYNIPPSIKPASRLISLKMDRYSKVYFRNHTVLDYITTKYIYLNHLELLCQWKSRTCGFNNEILYFHEIVSETERNDRFISNLPATIKSLKIVLNIFNNPIDALKGTGINPTELVFYNYRTRPGSYQETPNSHHMFPAQVIKNPKQFEYLEDLPLLKTLVLGISNMMEWGYKEFILHNVTNLYIKVKNEKGNGKCHIDQLLSSFPMLENLEIDQSDNAITIAKTYKRADHPHLRKLSIKNWKLTRSGVSFIRSSLPNLKDVTLLIFEKSRTVVRHWSPYELKYDSLADINEMAHDNTINLKGCKFNTFNITVDNWYRDETISTILYVKVETANEIKTYKPLSARVRNLKPSIVRIVLDDTKKFLINGKIFEPISIETK